MVYWQAVYGLLSWFIRYGLFDARLIVICKYSLLQLKLNDLLCYWLGHCFSIVIAIDII